jgi:hypothetical protein
MYYMKTYIILHIRKCSVYNAHAHLFTGENKLFLILLIHLIEKKIDKLI